MCSWLSFCLMVCGYQLMKFCTTFWILGILWLPVAWISLRSSCASLNPLNHFKTCLKSRASFSYFYAVVFPNLKQTLYLLLLLYISTKKIQLVSGGAMDELIELALSFEWSLMVVTWLKEPVTIDLCAKPFLRTLLFNHWGHVMA